MPFGSNNASAAAPFESSACFHCMTAEAWVKSKNYITALYLIAGDDLVAGVRGHQAGIQQIET